MMSERQKQIVKVSRINTVIEVLAFLGFFAPFWFLWVFLLRPTGPTITISLGTGICAIAVLFTPWTRNRTRLKRLRKYSDVFDPFFEAMIEDMERNDAEKDDTWKTESHSTLRTLFANKWDDILSIEDDYADDLPKLANYSAILYLRGMYE